MDAVLVENGKLCESPPNSGTSVLNERPPGAYTGARTVERNRIFLFDMHLERLAASFNLLFPSAGFVLSKSAVLDLFRASLQLALRTALQQQQRGLAARCELKLLLYVALPDCTSAASPSDLLTLVHVSAKPDRAPPIHIELRQHKARDNPHAKDSRWIVARAELEQQKPADVDEVVMYDASGVVSEGLSSNFGVLIGGAVHTAHPDAVLTGTVWQLLARICKQDGVPIHYDSVDVASRASWQGAFITSTTRAVLLCDQVRFPDLPDAAPLLYTAQPALLLALRERVADAMLANSREIVPLPDNADDGNDT